MAISNSSSHITSWRSFWLVRSCQVNISFGGCKKIFDIDADFCFISKNVDNLQWIIECWDIRNRSNYITCSIEYGNVYPKKKKKSGPKFKIEIFFRLYVFVWSKFFYFEETRETNSRIRTAVYGSPLTKLVKFELALRMVAGGPLALPAFESFWKKLCVVGPNFQPLSGAIKAFLWSTTNENKTYLKTRYVTWQKRKPPKIPKKRKWSEWRHIHV